MADHPMTKKELLLCCVLEGMEGGTLPMAQLKASVRAMAKRMMIKGILHRRDRRFARMTKRGRALFLRSTKALGKGEA